MTEAGAGRRIDKWLWCARQFRSRSAASTFVETQGVRVRRGALTIRVDKSAYLLTIGDEISFSLNDRIIVIRVTGFKPRRGSATEAASLFQRIEAL